MSQVYDEPIVVRLTQPVGPYPVGTEFGFKDVADAIRALGSSAYFTVVRTQDGDPIPPPTPEDLTEAERQALARARAARLIRGGEFDKVVPGPGEVIVGSEDGPVARDVSEVGGGGGGTFSANTYGARTDASWQTNRDAFQAANDAASAAGGGRVTAEPGIYLAKGIVQDSRVEFYLPNVTLQSPDGLAPHVLQARERTTTGSVAVGETTLTVADAAAVAEGAVIAIQGAGGILDTQNSTLVNAITAAQTTGITLANTTGLGTAGTLQVGEELIRFTGHTDGTLTGVTRGAFGTMAAAHAAGARIGVARQLYAVVEGVDGSTVTIDTPALLGVTNATVTIGAVGPKITGLTIDGNSVAGGAPSSVYGIHWPLVRQGTIKEVRVENADMGGVILLRGAADNHLDRLTLHNCGIVDGAAPKGSGLWLFQGTRRNLVTGLTVTGKAWTAVYIDDRTTVSAEGFDAPNEDNTFIGTTVKITDSPTDAILMVGSSRNRFLGGTLETSGRGFLIDVNHQGHAGDGEATPATGNEIGGWFIRALLGWRLLTPGNILHDVTVSADSVQAGNNAGNSLVYAASEVPGGPPATRAVIPNGTPSAPGLAFAEYPNTGLYAYGANGIAVSVLGSNSIMLFGNELRLNDGTRLTTGTTTGTRIGITPLQKLAFWGQTARTQPDAIPDTTGGDVAALEAEVNKLKALLRSIGLMAS